MFSKLNDLKNINKSILICTIILLILGVVLIQSSSSVEAVNNHEDPYYFVKRHLVYIGIGSLSLIFWMVFDYKKTKVLSILMILISFGLNLLLYTKYGTNKWGSTRWIILFDKISFMPSELLKFSSIIFVAALLDQFGDRIRNRSQVTFVFIIIGLIVGIVLGKDMGTSLVIAASLMAMLLVSGIKMSHLLVIAILGILGLAVISQLKIFEYRMKRLTSFLNPFDPQQDTYHLMNTLYAISMGGILGTGLGKGLQKFAHVPNVFSDSIFSVAGEELGLIGTCSIIVLYMIIIISGLKISSNTKDRFGKLLSTGITVSLGVQAFIHIMVNAGLAPITGITLPFISYGGTSIVICMSMIGILLNISTKERNK